MYKKPDVSTCNDKKPDVSTWNDKNIKFSQFLNQNTIKNVKLFVYLALRTTHLPNSVKNQHRLFYFGNFLCICIYTHTHTYKKKYLTIFLVGNICLYCLRFFLFYFSFSYISYISRNFYFFIAFYMVVSCPTLKRSSHRDTAT